MGGVISADDPKWIEPFSGLTEVQFARLVALVRRLDQPWRGIIDAGVVVGLAWGLAALWIFTARAFGPRGLDHPADVVP